MTDSTIRRTVRGFALLLLALPAAAQLPDAADQLLRRAAQGYRSAESYYFVASEKTTQTSGERRKDTYTMVLTAKDSEGRTRVEFDDRSNGGVAVFDGKDNWVYIPRMRRYAKLPTQQSDAARSGGLDFDVLARRFIDRYQSLDQRVVTAELLSRETIDLQEGEVECQVVKVLYETPPGMQSAHIERTYWITERTGLVVQERSSASMPNPQIPGETVVVRQEIDFQHAEVNQPFEEQMFVFAPPPGSQQVESLRPDADASNAPVAAEAPDFTLTDLAGNDVQLSSLRGEVVLLDFWATWCGPCRYDMPFVQALHEKYADKGLKVFGVNAGEPAGRARGYLESNGITFPTLLDGDMKTMQLYQVRAIPTFVVIDRQGRIAGYMRGTRTQEQIEKALLDAGL